MTEGHYERLWRDEQEAGKAVRRERDDLRERYERLREAAERATRATSKAEMTDGLAALRAVLASAPPDRPHVPDEESGLRCAVCRGDADTSRCPGLPDRPQEPHRWEDGPGGGVCSVCLVDLDDVDYESACPGAPAPPLPEGGESDRPPCESCGRPSVGRSLDDVPLCAHCGAGLEDASPQPAPAAVQGETCRGCPHPPHLGWCSRRNGDTANPCPCLHDSVPVAAQHHDAVPSGSERGVVRLEDVLERLRLAKAGDAHPRWHDGVQCAIDLIEQMRGTT